MNYRLSPDLALQHYFDELLSEENSAPQPEEVRPATTFAEPEPVDQSALPQDQQQKLQELLQTVALAAAPVVEPAATPVVPAVAPPPVVSPEVIETPVTAPEPTVATVADADLQVAGEWHENGRPYWAQQRFDVLLFQVSGLTLAVPLISLGQIQPLTDELTPLFGQADWFMGLQPTPSGKIRTVNTAKFVMPERYDENFLKTARYVVSINGVPWGLAVDSVNQPITLSPEDVRWRGERSKRPWLAGTIKEHMCALLDTEMIGKMLVAADKNSGRKPTADQ